MEFICWDCGNKRDIKTLDAHCQCGGLWSLDFKGEKFSLDSIDRDQWSIFRYRNFMALEDESWKDVSLGEGLTPIVRFNEDILLKMDYLMPSLSYKDRGAVMVISHCKSIGVKKIVQDSSGNAGNSIAAYAAKAGIECEIFVPEGTSAKKIDMIRAHGAICTVVPGTRDNCADVCRQKVKDEGLYYANHVYNPFFYEGTKTYIFEVFEELKRIPRNLLIPVGNGTLFIGVIKGLEALLDAGLIEEMPQIIGVQSQNCDPLVKAYENSSPIPQVVDVQASLAEGIAIGQPMRGKEILEASYKYGVRFVHAPEDEILKAREDLAKKGVYIEHTTAANLAGYREYCRLYGKTPDTLLPMTGAGLKSD